jgi:hypothetical protein
VEVRAISRDSIAEGRFFHRPLWKCELGGEDGAAASERWEMGVAATSEIAGGWDGGRYGGA